jgi:two-component system cell cycle sensor histidine kinase/response regulator CckA
LQEARSIKEGSGTGIAQTLVSAIRFLSEAVLLTESESGLDQVVFLNHAFQRLTGYSFEDLRGAGLTLLRGAETDNATLQRLLHPYAAEEVAPLEIVFYRKDATPFWDRVSLHRFNIGNKLYCVQVHSDITQQKEIEQQFILWQRREASSYLVSGLAHDFNNLLTAILVYSGLMAPKLADDAQLHHYLDEIRRSAERGAQVVAELMNLGRQDAAEPEIVDLREAVDESSDLLKRVLGEDIHLSIQADPDLRRVRVHPGRTQQVLLNLATNARDAMPQGGDLRIRLSNHDVQDDSAFSDAPNRTYVLLQVSDTGTGMDSETRSKIFNPFFTTKAKDQGTGMGLFTVRRIVEQYGGRIAVESEPGQGATFKILLPATSVEQTVAGKATILLLVEEEPLRRSLDAILSLRGYKVLPVTKREEALRIIQTHSGEIEIILTDAVALDRVREIHNARPGMKALFITGRTNKAQTVSGENINFVQKPFSASLLVQKIAELIGKNST